MLPPQELDERLQSRTKSASFQVGRRLPFPSFEDDDGDSNEEMSGRMASLKSPSVDGYVLPNSALARLMSARRQTAAMRAHKEATRSAQPKAAAQSKDLAAQLADVLMPGAQGGEGFGKKQLKQQQQQPSSAGSAGPRGTQTPQCNTPRQPRPASSLQFFTAQELINPSRSPALTAHIERQLQLERAGRLSSAKPRSSSRAFTGRSASARPQRSGAPLSAASRSPATPLAQPGAIARGSSAASHPGKASQRAASALPTVHSSAAAAPHSTAVVPFAAGRGADRPTGSGRSAPPVAPVHLRRFDSGPDIDQEIEEYVGSYKHSQQVPLAAIVLQSLWRARQPRIQFHHHMMLRTTNLRKFSAKFFYPWASRTLLRSRLRRVIKRRFFNAWLDYIDTYREVRFEGARFRFDP